MTDQKKVIDGLRWILEDDRFGFGDNWGDGEPRCDEERAGKYIWDAIELLKEQEPAKVVDGRPRCRFECGNCGTEFAFVYNYCPSCGRKVDWE